MHSIIVTLINVARSMQSARKVVVCALTACVIVDAAAAATTAASPAAIATAAPTNAADKSFYGDIQAARPSVPAMTAVGRALFFDKSLSASGKLACAGCHDPAHAFGPPDNAAVRQGGLKGRNFGIRAVPSLKYTQNVPPFTEHFFDDDGDDSADQGPAGGHTWDGRARSTHDQARLPLFSEFEMANAGEADVVEKVRHAPYAARFRAAFGDAVFADPALMFKSVLLALEVFQQSPADFYPYDSKYDAWLRGKAKLTAEEQKGLAVFNDASKGNCASCHPSTIKEGAFPQFTDFGYSALGAPRNKAIPANRDANFHDLGLCGPLRTDLATKTQYCGFFRTPSLRNVALRKVFFHNGAFLTLRDAVKFYARRDSDPKEWYPMSASGTVDKFDDLPSRYRDNVENEPPFGRAVGETPALNNAEIDAVVIFLRTLTDGYAPSPVMSN